MARVEGCNYPGGPTITQDGPLPLCQNGTIVGEVHLFKVDKIPTLVSGFFGCQYSCTNFGCDYNKDSIFNVIGEEDGE